MRTAVLATALVAWMLVGATCLPLFDDSSHSSADPTTLALVVQSPTTSTTVAQGATVPVRWTAYNSTGSPAYIDVYAESREDLAQTMIAQDVVLNSGSLTMTSNWDTTGLAGGEYVIYVGVTAGSASQSETATGRITIDEFPTLEFTAPTEDDSIDLGENTLTISWEASDPEADGHVTLGLDSDTDPENGNEIFIYEGTFDDSGDEDSYDWDGTDLQGNEVAEGTYNLFAFISDAVGAEQAVQANVEITVNDPDEDDDGGDDTITLSIISPDEDTTFLTGASLAIEFGVNEFDDALIDLKIDTDDDHTNGNEKTILAQRLVPAGTETDTFNWTGTLADTSAVADGIYRLFIVANTGATSPETAEGDGLVFRRTTATEPLIALLTPDDTQTVEAGSYVSISWRDDDPTGTATIRIMIDDDPNPDEATETGAAEIATEVVSRQASPDGVQDSYFYTVPSTLAPGRYYVFAYIGPSGSEQVSVAPGSFVVEDPTGK